MFSLTVRLAEMSILKSEPFLSDILRAAFPLAVVHKRATFENITVTVGIFNHVSRYLIGNYSINTSLVRF